MDAAATEILRESPLISVCWGMGREMELMPSMIRKSGVGLNLDSCRKYRFPETERKSLNYFLLKLQGKKQNDVQQQQASHAITIYYELVKCYDTSMSEPP